MIEPLPSVNPGTVFLMAATAAGKEHLAWAENQAAALAFNRGAALIVCRAELHSARTRSGVCNAMADLTEVGTRVHRTPRLHRADVGSGEGGGLGWGQKILFSVLVHCGCHHAPV